MKVRYSYLPQKFKNAEPVLEKIRDLLKSGDFTLGSAVTEFENKFAALIGAKYAIGVANGTDALRLSLKAVGVGPGDEVITGANSFIASAGAIAELSAKPVFVDMAPWYTLDADLIEEAITEKTKAILPVHFTGEPAEMDKILEVAARYNLPVIEDACQAVLAKYKGISCGNFGKAAAFSLHPLKNLNVWGDGGMIVTNDYSLNKQLRLMRNHGLKNRDEVSLLGCNSRLDSLQAIVGNWLIDGTVETTKQRRTNAAFYDKGLASLVRDEKVFIPLRREYVEQCFHLYMFEVEPDVRNSLVDFLVKNEIEAKIHYPIPMYQQAAFKEEYLHGAFPMADAQSDSVVTLPVDEHLTKEEQEFCIKKIREFFK